jgi:DNA polymerase III subunit gamma/tau
MSLYLRYRPSTLDEIVGNEATVASIRADFTKKDKPHAVLLTGETGCGKTTLARIIANMLGCKGNDFQELDSAVYRSIDTVREIRVQSNYRPLQSSCRVYLLDEVHQLPQAVAQPALLKSLEDTPTHVYYILATTDPQKLLPTIRGRCSQYDVNPLTEQQMFRLLHRVVKAENETLEKEVYQQIILDSQGHPRNALQILDQTLAVTPEQRLAVAKRQAEQQSATIELCRALIARSSWKKIRTILAGLKDQDPEGIRRAILGYCSSVLLKDENDTAAAIMEQLLEPQLYNAGFPGLIFAVYAAIK